LTNRFRGRLLRGGMGRLAASAQAVQTTLNAAGLLSRPATRRTDGPVDVAALLDRVLGRALPGAPGHAAPAAPPEAPISPQGGTFLSGTYAGPAGARPYRLFVPAHLPPHPALIVMLHGCTQSAEDFATGTRMNDHAANRGALVLYPVQVSAANMQKCWNWFNPADRQRDGGEAALIAGMTRQVMAEHAVDPARVFAAGLSAGGAQAAILGAAHPDLFAAVGVHSGLACGAASDMQGAFAAMRQGRPGAGHHVKRTIIFHGDADSTVHVRNADAVAEQVATGSPLRTESGTSPGGLAYTRTLQQDGAIERWTIHGAGHAWSGGSPAGTFTEPRGPDASAAMLDFFLSK
jgi:poly(hydroxyalkanoate) depolymerase family esterase